MGMERLDGPIVRRWGFGFMFFLYLRKTSKGFEWNPQGVCTVFYASWSSTSHIGPMKALQGPRPRWR